MDEDFRKAALDYHRLPIPGKLTIEATKRMATQRDLALAYSPGVAAAGVADHDDAPVGTARRGRWCGREDSNFHGVSPTSTSSLRVYHSATTAP